jgi:hypothetical protein
MGSSAADSGVFLDFEAAHKVGTTRCARTTKPKVATNGLSPLLKDTEDLPQEATSLRPARSGSMELPEALDGISRNPIIQCSEYVLILCSKHCSSTMPIRSSSSPAGHGQALWIYHSIRRRRVEIVTHLLAILRFEKCSSNCQNYQRVNGGEEQPYFGPTALEVAFWPRTFAIGA